MGIDINQLSPWAQKQIARKLALQNLAKQVDSEVKAEKRKYNNQPTDRDVSGKQIKFDSRAEARRYDELMLLLKAGKIRDLRLQPQYTLQEAYTTPEGERIRAVKYVADFSYEKEVADIGRAKRDDTGLFWKDIPTTWALVVEDVKSKVTKTKVYAIKKKMLRDKYGITVQEVE